MVSLSERAHLVTLYNEPHRHYHNLEHIMHCLRELADLHEAGLIGYVQNCILSTALWYHDAVYDPRAVSGLNEAESAGLLPFSTDPLVAEMIYASQTHVIPEDAPEKSKSLFAYFLDIDLAILGQSRSDYDNYARKIRMEYSFVPEDDYAEGRKRVLSSLLARDRIYVSDHFHTKYERAAQENLEREVQHLSRLRGESKVQQWMGGLSQGERHAWAKLQVMDALAIVETPGHRMPSEVEKILADEIRRLQSANLEKVD